LREREGAMALKIHSKKKQRLYERVVRAAETALAARGYVSAIDVFMGAELVEPDAVMLWRKGSLPYFERIVKTNLSRISLALSIFQQWAHGRGLKPSETDYVRKKSGGQRLRFSKSGNPNLERIYRMHYVDRARARKAPDAEPQLKVG
jgi:hypothetical protein